MRVTTSPAHRPRGRVCSDASACGGVGLCVGRATALGRVRVCARPPSRARHVGPTLPARSVRLHLTPCASVVCLTATPLRPAAPHFTASYSLHHFHRTPRHRCSPVRRPNRISPRPRSGCLAPGLGVALASALTPLLLLLLQCSAVPLCRCFCFASVTVSIRPPAHATAHLPPSLPSAAPFVARSGSGSDEATPRASSVPCCCCSRACPPATPQIFLLHSDARPIRRSAETSAVSFVCRARCSCT